MRVSQKANFMFRFLSAEEAMASGEIGCHSATIPRQVLQQLSELPYDSSKQPGEGLPMPPHPYLDALPTPSRLAQVSVTDPLAPSWDGKLAVTDVDYLANNGALLDTANENDPETKRRLSEALEAFVGAEKRSQAKIEEAMNSL